MASMIYPAFKRSMGNGAFDFASDSLRCVLLTNAHTPDTGHTVYADVAGDEVSGTGYIAGGKTLSNVSWTLSGTAAILTADDPSWSAATVTARYAAIYADKTTGGQVDPLLCLLDFGSDTGVLGGTFSVSFVTSGILSLD